MYDGINALAAGIARQFPNAPKVAGYVTGPYAWSQADWNLFPHADHVTISTTASANAGDVLDVEAGDATPNQSAGWIAMRHAAGLYRPTIYCSRLVIPAVRAGTGSYILGRDYDIWVADYTGSPHEIVAPGNPMVNCAATQYESTQDYDVSMVYDTAWPHRKPDHAAPGIPAPAGPSGTDTAADIGWHAVPGAVEYRYQWRDGGGHISQALTAGTHVAALALSGPGPHSWRVQAANGAWTDWQAIS
jgi:hypothetical protein